MEQAVYTITECDELLDICDSEEQAIEAVNILVKKRIDDFGCSEDEARDNITYKKYELNQLIGSSS